MQCIRLIALHNRLHFEPPVVLGLMLGLPIEVDEAPLYLLVLLDRAAEEVGRQCLVGASAVRRRCIGGASAACRQRAGRVVAKCY